MDRKFNNLSQTFCDCTFGTFAILLVFAECAPPVVERLYSWDAANACLVGLCVVWLKSQKHTLFCRSNSSDMNLQSVPTRFRKHSTLSSMGWTFQSDHKAPRSVLKVIPKWGWSNPKSWKNSKWHQGDHKVVKVILCWCLVKLHGDCMDPLDTRTLAWVWFSELLPSQGSCHPM